MELFRVMTRDPATVEATATVRDAARLMAVRGVGALPVVEWGRPVGMLTGRDIAVRVVARGLDPDTTTVGEVMTIDVAGLPDLLEVEDAVELMEERHVRRVVALGEGYVTGIVGLYDLARSVDVQLPNELIEEVTKPHAHDV